MSESKKPQDPSKIPPETISEAEKSPALPDGVAQIEDISSDTSNEIHAAGKDQAPSKEPKSLDIQQKLNPKYESVPDFDFQQMYAAMIQFIQQLETTVPEKRKETVEEMKKYLKEVIIDIALQAKKLKTLTTHLSKNERALVAEATTQLPQDKIQIIEKYADLELNHAISLLHDLGRQGMGMIATVDKIGFRINKSTIEKMLKPLRLMVDCYKELSVDVRKNKMERERIAGIKQTLMLEISKQGGYESIYGGEDLADNKIEDMLYQELLDCLAQGVTPEVFAEKYMFALTFNASHLQNGFASQRIGTMDIYLEDINEGIEADENYYDKSNNQHLFKSEAEAAAFQITTLARCLKAVTATQRLIDLMLEAKKTESVSS